MHKALGGDLTAERGDHMIYTSAVMVSERGREGGRDGDGELVSE